MKKTLFILLIALFGMCSFSHAQSADRDAQKAKKSQRFEKRMTLKLELTDTQVQEMRSIMEETKTSGTKGNKRAAFYAAFEEILTPEQVTKLNALQAERKGKKKNKNK